MIKEDLEILCENDDPNEDLSIKDYCIRKAEVTIDNLEHPCAYCSGFVFNCEFYRKKELKL